MTIHYLGDGTSNEHAGSHAGSPCALQWWAAGLAGLALGACLACVTVQLCALIERWAVHLCALTERWAVHLCALIERWAVHLCALIERWAVQLCALIERWAVHLCALTERWAVQLCALTERCALGGAPRGAASTHSPHEGIFAAQCRVACPRQLSVMLRSVASAGPLSIASAVPLSIASYEALKAPAAALLGECVSPMWLMGRVVLG